MFRRILATVLWAYFGWYVMSYMAALADIPPAFAALGGLAMGAVALVDLRRIRTIAVEVVGPKHA